MKNRDLTHLSEEGLKTLLAQASLPRHVAIIMDGNGRWASQRGLPRVAGHRAGGNSVEEAVMTCHELGISALTLYAFSLENWKRPKDEIGMLMGLFCEYFRSETKRFLEKKICFRAIGRLDRLPLHIQTMIRELEEASRGHDRMTVILALSYGGRDEIVEAVKKILDDASRGVMTDQMINEDLFAKYLATSGLPDPDLLIRTSGECRVSNFLLWQIAYAELYFTEKFWPDFRRRDMLLALLEYQRRERRLGGLSPSETSGMNGTWNSSVCTPLNRSLKGLEESTRQVQEAVMTSIGPPQGQLGSNNIE